MQELKTKTKKIHSLYFWILLLPLTFCLLNFTGCATVPGARDTFPTYSLNGTTYMPLVSLCNQRDINLDYDTFTRKVTLNKDAHTVNLVVGDTLVLVDSVPKYLKHPVDIHQGTVVVPYRFKEQILDTLFRKFYPTPRVALPITKIKRIVIDAGHGGSDPGAIGRTGLREKDVNLDVAKRLSKLLMAQGVDVVMTRSADKSVPLSTRVSIANNSRADLFISIHANANRVRSLSGFEVYYVSPKASDSARALSSAKNSKLDIDRSCFASSSVDLKAILWDMVYTSSRAESIELSQSICRTTDRNLDVRILGIKSANFYVLKGVHMPAVLIEMGFLSNYNEERRLKNSYYRQQIASAIAEGVGNYSRECVVMEASR